MQMWKWHIIFNQLLCHHLKLLDKGTTEREFWLVLNSLAPLSPKMLGIWWKVWYAR